MPDGVSHTLNRHDGQQARDMLGQLADLYVPAYAEPPYKPHPMFSREAFLERTTRQTHRDGFTLITAHAAAQQLAGFAFGFTLAPGRWWRDVSGSTPPADIVNASKFAVVELVIAPPHRDQGLARRILNALLDGRPEQHAVLLAQPDTPARVIYAHWGWTEIAKVQSQPNAETDDALTLKL
ncbi:GNAT family N-acetyltransferase [Spirillospora sp. NPDC127200]